MIELFAICVFTLIAGLTMLFDGADGNDKIGQVFACAGGLGALMLGVAGGVA